MPIKANLYAWCSQNRVARFSLNTIGAVARGLTKKYVPARARVCYEIAAQSPPQIIIGQEGIGFNGSLIQDSSFLAETFLKNGITQLNLGQNIDAKELIALSCAKEMSNTANISLHVEPERAEKLYEGVIYSNFQRLIKVNSLGSIFSNLIYFTYRASAGISPFASSSLDYLFSIGIFCGLTFFTLFNISKMYTTLRSLKYVEPTASEEDKIRAAGEKGPRVTLLIPVYKEPRGVVKKTLTIAAGQEYRNLEIVLLIDDEAGTANYQAMIEAVAEVNASLPQAARPIKYFSRKKHSNIANKEKNKADNVNAFLAYAKGNSLVEALVNGEMLILREEELGGYANAAVINRYSFQDFEYLSMLDADDEVSPDFLRETVPIIEQRTDLAVLQTSKNIGKDNPTPIEGVGALITNSLWQIFQRGVDANDATYCGGTGCVIRFSALEEVSQNRKDQKNAYFPTDNITEDFCLTLDLLKLGWKSKLLARTFSIGQPVSCLADHFAQYWRYVEGPIEGTITHTIPMMIRDKLGAFSRKWYEFSMKGIQPFYGWFLAFFQFLPLAAVFDVHLPVTDSSVFLPTWIALILFNSNVSKTYAQSVKGTYSDHIKASVLMYLHFPVFCHATISAIKNRIFDKNAVFSRTKKDGSRSRVPLRYLIPLASAASLNIYSLVTSLAKVASTGQTWLLEPALWSSLNITILGYGMAKFNGIKNTARDFYYGISEIFRMKKC